MEKAKLLSLAQREFLNALQTSTDGLSQQAAGKRLPEYGKDQLKMTGHYPPLGFIGQFQSSLLYLPVAACLISVWLRDHSDASLIAIILFINTTLEFFKNTNRKGL